MLIKTLDLHHYSICPRKYFSEANKVKYSSPAREVMKRIVLSKALGRENKWTIKGIASVWDNIFWKNKSATQNNVDASVKGSISLKKLFNKLPEAYDVYSSNNLLTAIESDLYIQSSSDFIIVSERGVEIWIYSQLKLNEVRRSLIGAGELFVIRRCLRKEYLGEESIALDYTANKNTYLVFYNSGKNSMNPSWFRIKCSQNNSAIISLANQIKKKVEFSNPGEQCKGCKVNC